MSHTRTFNLKDFKCVVAVYPLETSGFDGFVKVTRDQPFFQDGVDCNGNVYRWANNDPRGTIEITLTATSGENAYLSLLYYIDCLTLSGIFPVVLMDLSSHDVHVASLCWITKIPDRVYAKSSGEAVWVIRAASVDSFLGGGK